MAVVPRKRAGGIVYGVSTSRPGHPDHWELVGPNRREAERINALRKREVKAGTFRPTSEVTDATLVRSFAASWLDTRKNRSADNDVALITKHVLSVEWFASLRMGDVEPQHVNRLIRELKAGSLSEKSVSLVMGLVRVMFRDATIDGIYKQTPYLVPRGTLKRSGVKRFPYTVAEARALLSEPVGERERLWNFIALLTGARCGEVCGLRWSDWDETPTPLGALVIERQYGGEVLKTERPRIVPVHTVLAAALAWWRERWSFYFLRRPTPGDLIVPRLALGDIEPMSKSSAYKAWLRSCASAQVTNRSVHSTRHTFITVARRNGADKEAVELVTHNPKGTIVDRYTTRDWEELCRAVLCVSYGTPMVDRSVDGRSLIPCFAAPEPGLEPGQPTENPGQLAIVRGTAGFGTWPDSRRLPEPDARVDARQPASIRDELLAADDRAFRAKARFWFRARAA